MLREIEKVHGFRNKSFFHELVDLDDKVENKRPPLPKKLADSEERIMNRITYLRPNDERTINRM